MPEGLLDPSVAPLPGPVRAGLGAVVRVSARIRFRVRVYPTQAEAEAARRLPGAFSVEERPGGGVAWPFHISVPELAHLRADALLRLQPGRFDVVQHTAALTLHTLENVWEGETPELPGSATGFLIGRHAGLALIATNYHVAREAVLRLGREGGQARWTPEATRDTRVAVGTEENGLEQASQYREVEGVQLVANASREEWQAGLDWAVLGVPARETRHLPCLRLAERAEPGEPVWALGFPVRTERGPRGYPDADGTLRVSQGLLLGPEPGVGMQGWRADLDGLSGNSGSPVVNARGEVVGLFRNHTHYDHPDTGPVDRRFVEYGGEAQVAPADPLRHFLDSLA